MPRRPRAGRGQKRKNAPSMQAKGNDMTKRRFPVRAFGLITATVLLAGCENPPQGLAFLQPKDRAADGSATPSTSTRLIERDVEAPEVFQVTEAGLWDGRPSLGGVWVAHPDVVEPERVIIRNSANGKFVIGALFRRERDIPGPRLQTSSDAAAALGMLAGAPVQLNVTALRRESVPDAVAPPEEVDRIETAEEITEQTLDPVAAAAAVLDTPAPEAISTVAPAPAPATAAPRAASSLDKPFIQIGIFSIEKNAQNTAAMMRNAGMVPTVLAQTANGRSFWRVLVGPAQSASERGTLLKQVKEVGFTDAYPVTN